MDSSFAFGKRRRRSRSRRRRSRRSPVDMEVKVSRRRSRRSRRGSKRSKSAVQKLFKQRVKAVQALMKKGMGRKAAWKKVMSGRAFGVQVIPGF